MPNADQLIKLGGLLVQLRSDAAYKPISKWRHSAENNSRPVLYDSVSLRQERQDEVSFVHRSIRAHAMRWIGFSEDDGWLIAEGARYQAPKPHLFSNALRTTRSTFGAKIGLNVSYACIRVQTQSRQGRVLPKR